MKLLSIIKKNFAIVLNNPSSLIFLMLFPIIFIGIVGFTFSSNDYYNVKIGIFDMDENKEMLERHFPNSQKIQLIHYSPENCFKYLERTKLDACLNIKLEDKNAPIPKYIATIYLDNSRTISPYLKEFIVRKINEEIDNQKIGKLEEVNEISEKNYNRFLEIERRFENLEREIGNLDKYLNSIKKIHTKYN